MQAARAVLCEDARQLVQATPVQQAHQDAAARTACSASASGRDAVEIADDQVHQIGAGRGAQLAIASTATLMSISSVSRSNSGLSAGAPAVSSAAVSSTDSRRSRRLSGSRRRWVIEAPSSSRCRQ